MDHEKTIEVRVKTLSQEYWFVVLAHRTENPSERHIEPEFYAKDGYCHQGVHYELEIVKSPVWRPLPSGTPIHIHRKPGTETDFVCFTGHLQTVEAAKLALKTWAIGTVFTLEYDMDFAPLVEESGTGFLHTMEEEFGITAAVNDIE